MSSLSPVFFTLVDSGVEWWLWGQGQGSATDDGCVMD